MKKISTFVSVFVTVIILTSCSQPGPDFSKMGKTEMQWSFIKSPHTGLCYEMVGHQEFTGFSWIGFSGMSPVDDKYCAGK